MAKKRKSDDATDSASRKTRCLQIIDDQKRNDKHSNHVPPVSHDVLSCYYPRVVTLRQFLVSRLPISSTAQRRRLSTYGSDGQAEARTAHPFDSTLVGVFPEAQVTVKEARKRDFLAFTQSQQRTNDQSDGGTQDVRFAKIVEFAIWTLFNKARSTSQRPNHVLCHGFYRGSKHLAEDHIGGDACVIPGLVNRRPNENFRILKQTPWSEIPNLLGTNGGDILLNLLLDCGIFVSLEAGKNNYYQLSGIPLSELDLIHPAKPSLANKGLSSDKDKLRLLSCCHKPAGIVFVRNRMFHSRPALNARGDIRFGMKHIYVFNRFPHHDDVKHVVHNMMYVFPRQFGLHNVFTSIVNKKETVQSLKDYTLREHEIAQRVYMRSGESTEIAEVRPAGRLPKRLRNGAQTLVQKLLKNHHSCSYTQLLQHHCPAKTIWLNMSANPNLSQFQSSSVSSTHLITQAPAIKSTNSTNPASQNSSRKSLHHQNSSPIVGYASPTANVSAFCQSAMRRLLPRDVFGVGVDGARNMSGFMACIDRFISMRRFESLSLHEVVQGIKITSIRWLRPPRVAESANMSFSDRQKRLEILLEFVYYLIDSVLIPLVRSNFYVTESSAHRNQLFYFRHDIWRKLSEPSLAVLKIKMFEELKPQSTSRSLNPRSLGISNVRLLPKNNTFRPIINLRRRAMRKIGGVAVLGQSINKQLEPVSNILNYEKVQRSAKLGSALFSVGELHDRLLRFKRGLTSAAGQQLYFVKVDVQTCFDTIPQAQLLKLTTDLISSDRYEIGKHAEIKAGALRWHDTSQKPSRRFPASAYPAGDFPAFSPTIANELARFKKHIVYNNTGNAQVWDTIHVTKLLQEHVQMNVIKIGKRYYRQKNGIPQGSLLSSLLCSFFYGDFEMKHLDFLVEGESLLLRLIDDFLLVTTNPNHARRFLQVMADGSEEYGISVNTKKSLANFEIFVNKSKIPRLHGSTGFPYCGMLIDTRTLEVSKDRTRKDSSLANTLTVDFDRRPGHSFHRKVLMSLKIQMHAMVLDTSLNAPAVVGAGLYQTFTEVAMKMHRYLVSLPQRKRPTGDLIIKAIKDLVKFASNATSGTRRTKQISEWTCSIPGRQIQWLAAAAFEDVLKKKQTAYADVLSWLRDLQLDCETGMNMSGKIKQALIEGKWRALQDCRF